MSEDNKTVSQSLLEILREQLEKENQKKTFDILRGNYQLPLGPVTADFKNNTLYELLHNMTNNKQLSYRPQDKEYNYTNGDFRLSYNTENKNINVNNGESGGSYSPSNGDIQYGSA